MAYVVSVTNSSPGSVSSFTPTLPTHASGDLILILCTHDGVGSTETISATGWTTVPGSAASGAQQSSWVYKVAASSSETAPNISGSSGADQWAVSIIIIRDPNASPLGSSPASGTDYVQASWNAAWYADTGSLTTGADDCLLIYACSMDTDNDSSVQMRTAPKDVTLLTDYIETTASAVRHMVCYVPSGASGSAAPTSRFWFNNSTGGTQQGGNTWVLAIRNEASGILQRSVKAGIDALRFYGDFKDSWSDTYQAPSNFAATINSVSVDTNVATSTATDLNNPPGKYTEIQSSLNTAGAWVGMSHAITSTNMDGKSFYLQWEIASRARVGTDGWCVGFSDGTNWALFQFSAYSSSIVIDAPLYNVIALGTGRSTPLYSSGTIDWTAVTRVAYIWYRDGSSTSQGVMRIKNAMLIDTAKFVGGSSATPSQFSLLPPAAENCGYPDIDNLQGTGQTMVRQNVQIGDGATDTYFDLSAQSIEYPQAFDATDAKKRKFNFAANAMTVGIYPSAADTLNVTAGIVATAVEQALTVNASASTSATVSTAGSSFVGFVPTWKTGIACNSATFKQCGTIDFKGADITSVIANEGTDDALISASDGFSATGCTFTASATAVYCIRIAAAGTFSLDATTFSGFTKDIDVTAATGTVTINLADGQATPTYQTAGATVSIVSNPVYQSVTVSGLVAGSRVQLFDTGTANTEIYNDIVVGTSFTWTDSNPAANSRVIRARITKVSTVTAYEMIEASIGTCGTSAGSEDVSYIANQVLDATYNTNAIDGSTVTDIQIDDSTNLVKINLSATGTFSNKAIYAYQVYWLNTETGIRDDFAFIEAPDTANYIYTSFQWKNIGTGTLTIIDGYPRDVTTNLSQTLIDTTGGNICVAPDHVIPYATGSGLTAGQAIELTATATKTANLTYSGLALQVDIQKVLGTTIQTGSSSTASIGY